MQNVLFQCYMCFLDETNNNNFETAMEFCQKGHHVIYVQIEHGASPIFVARSDNSTISLQPGFMMTNLMIDYSTIWKKFQ